MFCVGRPIKYKLVHGSGITLDWCNKHVVPGIWRFYSDNNNSKMICNVLAVGASSVVCLLRS